MLVAVPETVERLFAPLSGHHPLFILAVYAPAISAFGLVLARGGVAGLMRFAGRLGLWRIPVGWTVFLVLGIPAVYYLGAWLTGAWPVDPFPFPSAGAALAASAFMLILGPMEEFSWRRVALPILQRHMAPVWAGALLGLIWGIWHLPAFLLQGTPQSSWDFAPFLLGSRSRSA